MLFNSYQFLVFFPIVCLVYFVIPRRFQHMWLLMSSYFFYMCWNAKYAVLLLFVTVVTFLCGIIIGNHAKKDRNKKMMVGIGVIVCLSVLFLFKYVNLFGSTFNFIIGRVGIGIAVPSIDFVLPVGISFYTFQALSYVIDVYRGDVRGEKNFLKYALFVSFFPQLVAGPIERSKNLLHQVNEEHEFNYENMRHGLLLMVWGMFLKLVIADRAAMYVDTVYGNISSYGGEYVLMAAILFSIQIYCDFAGYSIIAIGAAKVMGFTLMENFNRPYLASTVEEFWRNWHISLTSWFRDYLYIPLGGNRKGKLRKYINIMIVFLVSGLWHGAGWHFVLWGGINGLYQVIGDLLKDIKESIRRVFRIRENSKALLCCRMAVTCAFVGFAWIFFRADSMGVAITGIKSIINSLANGYNMGTLHGVFINVISGRQFFVLGIAIAILLIADILKYNNINVPSWIVSRNRFARWSIYLLAVMSIVIFGIWGPEFSAGSFIYFQF